MSWMMRLLLSVCAIAIFVSVGTAEEEKKAVVAKKTLDREELEQGFIRMMNGATFRGTWQMVDGEGLKGKGKLSEPRTEQYSISRVVKVHSDRWLVMARIQYGEKDVSLPVPVRVVWAEDTPIITLDEMDLPGLGKYSARVMVYRNFYSGTWFGDSYGGILSGQIVKVPAGMKETSPDKMVGEHRDY